MWALFAPRVLALATPAGDDAGQHYWQARRSDVRAGRCGYLQQAG